MNITISWPPPTFCSGLPTSSTTAEKGVYVQDADVINQFRTSSTYQASLRTHGGCLWESDFDDSRAIYANVWVDNVYKGRLLLDDDGTPYSKGKLLEISYFAEAIAVLIRSRENIPQRPHGMEKLIVEAIEGKEPQRSSIRAELNTLGWEPEGPYIAGILSLLGSDFSKFSIYSICANLEDRVEGSYTCYHKGHIYLLVNLSISHLTAQDLRMRMAYIIREGLMHMGVSHIFQDFFQFPVYFRQAAITLRYQEKSASTVWYSEFCSYALKYWLTEGIGSLTKESILPSELSLLQAYDRKNSTNLFQTLQIYLETERNSTLTSQLLGIHRSTLPSRLYRIQQLTNLNLDEAETRLYLLNGFYALKNL